MPLFNKKFEAKPIPARLGRCNIGHAVVTEDLDDFRQISLNLGNKELRFADGIWMHSARKSDVDDMLRLNKKFRALEEENNMCNLKIEVMLDLLAEHATELNELKPTKEKNKVLLSAWSLEVLKLKGIEKGTEHLDALKSKHYGFQ